MKLIRGIALYKDGDGNVRTVTYVRLRPSTDTICKHEHLYSNPSNYKFWLRSVLAQLNVKINQVDKETSLYESKNESKSFYSISNQDLWGWFAFFVVSMGSSRGFTVAKYHDSLIEAIEHMKQQPTNHNFEIVLGTNTQPELYPMSDESMVLAVLKYG